MIRVSGLRGLVLSASIVASMLGGVAGTAIAAPAQADAAGIVDAGRAHRGHHHGRHGDLLRASLRLDSLSPQQKQQIEALVAKEKSAHANVRAARAQLLNAVASGIDSGNVSPQALQPQVNAVVSAELADEPGDRAALEQLHTILTPAQRSELVSKITAPRRVAAIHWQDGGAPREAHGMKGGPLGALNLSDAQRAQIKSAMQSQRAPRAALEKSEFQMQRQSHEAMLKAFASDRFVMNELVPPKSGDEVSRKVDRMVKMASVTTPILDGNQRSIASNKLRAMAAHESR